MNLPQELIDEILSHLPWDDRQSLGSCSLVSKSWLDSSRRLLFPDITIGFGKYESFRNAIPPTNTDLLRHVRSLKYFERPGMLSLYPHLACAIQEYLPSLSRLQALTLSNITIEPTVPDRLDIFSACRQTLSSLSFSEVTITWNALASLIGYFPDLVDLEISLVSFMADDKDRRIPRPSHPLRGKLWIEYMPACNMDVLVNGLSQLEPEYEVLAIDGEHEEHHRIFSVVQKSLKLLVINRPRVFSPSNTPLSLSNCSELQEVHICTARPSTQEVALFSSITSLNLQRILFLSAFEPLSLNSLLDNSCWLHFDDMVCELVDRLSLSGYQHTLEVDIWIEELIGPAFCEGLLGFLPKVREKGIVTIFGASGRIVIF